MDSALPGKVFTSYFNIIPYVRFRWKGKQNYQLENTKNRILKFRQLAASASWKNLYHDAEVKARTKAITMDELVNMKWRFYFKFSDWESTFFHEPVFRSDGKLVMMGRTMSWRFVSDSVIQVERYPVLNLVRMEHNWGYRLSNFFVWFDSIDPELHLPPKISYEDILSEFTPGTHDDGDVEITVNIEEEIGEEVEEDE